MKSVKTDVREMRAKMQDHLGSDAVDRSQGKFHQQDAGGIVDIEFMAQFAVLAYAQTHPSLTTWTIMYEFLKVLATLADVGN